MGTVKRPGPRGGKGDWPSACRICLAGQSTAQEARKPPAHQRSLHACMPCRSGRYPEVQLHKTLSLSARIISRPSTLLTRLYLLIT